MISTLVVFHRSSAGLHLRMHFICLSRSDWPGVTAPQEWTVMPVKHSQTRRRWSIDEVINVRKCFRCRVSAGRREGNVPPIFEAAIPVLAVTETTPGFLCFFLRVAMMARSSSDFPVPGERDSG